MFVTININIREMHETKTFKLRQEDYECWIIHRAFWLTCSVKVYRPTFETDRLIFEYFCKYDYEKMEKWLKEHGEQK